MAIFGDQDVKRFDVSVDDVMRVAMQKGQAQLPGDLPDFFLGEILSLALLLVNEGLHVPLLGKFHCNVHASALGLGLGSGLLTLPLSKRSSSSTTILTCSSIVRLSFC